MYMDLNMRRHVVIIRVFWRADIARKWYQSYECAAKITMPVESVSASRGLLYISKRGVLSLYAKLTAILGCRELDFIGSLGYLWPFPQALLR